MKSLKLMTLVFVLFLSACAQNAKQVSNAPEAIIPTTGVGSLSISPVTFEEHLQLRDAVKNECKLLTKLPAFVKSYASDQYASISTESANTKTGDHLFIQIVEITNSKKNLWTGQGVGQYIGVEGYLMKKGKKVASFKGRRSTTGGFMGGYKGTCALLGRCTKTLGKDIASWLKNPVDNARLGNM